MTKFIGKIKLGPNDIGSNEVVVSYEKNETELLYDEVENDLLDEMHKLFPQNYFPKAEISEIFISKYEDKCEKECLYPVVSDSEADEKTDKFKNYKTKYDKILVLQSALYVLTPEMRLHFSLIEQGILNINDEFNFEKMHNILMTTKESKKVND
jgi:hypothetical protein